MAPLSRFDLPGFSLPLNYAPPRENHRRTMFRNALDYNDIDDGGAG